MTPPKRSKRPPARRTDHPEPPRPGPAALGDLPMAGTSARHPGLGLGLWSLGRWSREDETRTRATVEHALDRALPWFDTAEVYGAGRSERILGDALARRPDAGAAAFVTTKVSWEHLRGPMVRAALLGSLQRLSRTQVDVYLIHAPDPRTPIGETMGVMDALYSEGRIKAVGVSNFSLGELVAARAALRSAPLVVNQIRFNLLERSEGDPLVEYCRKEGIVLEAYTPLARGLLAGRYLDEELPKAEVRRFARDLFDRDRFQELQQRARALRALAEKEGVPMASLALHWLARRGAAPVFGASRPEQVDQALEAWSTVPGDAALERADAIARGDRA